MVSLFVFGIIGLLFVGAGGYLYSYLSAEERERNRRRLRSRIVNAEALLQSGMADDAAQIYREVLGAVEDGNKRAVYPDIYALCRYGEAGCDQKKADSDPAACVNAINCYEEFLRLAPQLTDEDEEGEARKAEASYRLGLLYASYVKKLSRKDQRAVLKRAETLLASSLESLGAIAKRVYSREYQSQPERTAARVGGSVQMTLAAVYASLSEFQGSKNGEITLLKALDAHESALQVYTSEEYPVEYAVVLRDTVNTHTRLFELTGNAGFLDSAIARLERLAHYMESAKRDSDLFSVCRELGEAHLLKAKSLSESEDKNEKRDAVQEPLSSAFRCYERMATLAGEGGVAVSDGGMAEICQKMGDIKNRLYQLTLQKSDLEGAIALYEKALGHVEEGSVDYANVQSMLGSLFVVLGGLQDRKANVGKAKAAYSIALEIYDDKGLTAYKQSVEATLREIVLW